MYIPPDLRQQLAEHDLVNGLRGDWRSDPTYDMKKRSARTAPPARRDNSQAEHPRAVAEPAGPLNHQTITLISPVASNSEV